MKKVAILLLALMCVFTTRAMAGEPVVPPSGYEPETYSLYARQYDSTQGGWVEEYRQENVKVIFAGDDVYVSGLAYWFKQSYVKGHIDENNKVTFESGQWVGSDTDFGDEYLIGLRVPTSDGEDYELADFVMSYDEETRALTLDNEYIIGESASRDATDQLYDYMELVTLTPGALPLPDVATPPADAKVEGWYLKGMQDESRMVKAVNVAFSNQDIYLQGICDYLPTAWVKGTVTADGKVTFPSGQFYGQLEGYNLYFVGYNGSFIKDVVFSYDTSQGILSTEDFILVNTEPDQYAMVSYLMEVEITRNAPSTTEEVEVPQGLQTEEYVFTAMSNTMVEGDPKKGTQEHLEQEAYSAVVHVGIDGRYVYMQGLSRDCPSGWARGMLSADGKHVSFPASQYLGTSRSTFGDYDYYLTSADEDKRLVSVVFNYDDNTGTFTTDQDVYINGSAARLYYYYWFTDVRIEKKGDEAATPATPAIKAFGFYNVARPYVEVLIPCRDTAGNAISTDKLTYAFVVEKEGSTPQLLQFDPATYRDFTATTTEVPYNFTRQGHYDFYESASNADEKTILLHFSESELKTWKSLGVKSIYHGGGEARESGVAWFDVEGYFFMNGVASPSLLTPHSSQIFDLKGRRLCGKPHGVVIKEKRKILLK